MFPVYHHSSRLLWVYLVWVLAENPSRRFYGRLGGRPVYEKTVIIGGVPLLEVGYGWQDVHTLIEPPERQQPPAPNIQAEVTQGR
jgi:hypothetical protein